MASIRPWPNFDARADAEALRKAMKGFGTDEKTITDIICKRSNAQRQEIRTAFKVLYGKNLIKDLLSELSGRYEDVIVALMQPCADYDAMELQKAMKGIGTDESTLVQILCTRSNAEITSIKNAFKALYGSDLEKAVASETSGHFRRLLVSMLQAGRDESTHVDVDKAKRDAKALYDAGENRLGTDESTFNAIVCAQNQQQLIRCFNEYYTLVGHHIDDALKAEFSGDLLEGLMTVVKCINNRPAYFAEKLHESMKGMGTRDNLLIRTVVSRSEVDLALVKHEFQKMFNTSLEDMIKSDTSGDYKNALITLVRGNH